MGKGVHSTSVLCIYFLVAICILAAPFLKMNYHRILDKFADTNVCVEFLDGFVLVLTSN